MRYQFDPYIFDADNAQLQRAARRDRAAADHRARAQVPARECATPGWPRGTARQRLGPPGGQRRRGFAVDSRTAPGAGRFGAQFALHRNQAQARLPLSAAAASAGGRAAARRGPCRGKIRRPVENSRRCTVSDARNRAGTRPLRRWPRWLAWQFSRCSAWAWHALAIAWQRRSREAWPAVEVLHDGRPREPRPWPGMSRDRSAAPGRSADRARPLRARAQARARSAAAMTALADTHARVRRPDRGARLGDVGRRRRPATCHAPTSFASRDFAPVSNTGAMSAIAALQALHQLDPGDGDAGFRLLDALIGAARMDEAGEPARPARCELKSPSIDRARLALMKARMAAIRGDQKARAQSGRGRLRPGVERPCPRRCAARTRLGAACSPATSTKSARPWHVSTRCCRRRPGPRPRRAGRCSPQCCCARKGSSPSRSRRSMPLPSRHWRWVSAAGSDGEARRRLCHDQSRRDTRRPSRQLNSVCSTSSRSMGDPRAQASTLDVLSIAQQRAGDLGAAEGSAKAALQAYLDAGDLGGEASARNTLGMLLARSGRTADAQEQWEKALALFERSGDRRGEATTRSNLAILYARAGRVDAAREANEAALAAFRDVDATLDVARLQFNLGVQDRRAGRIVEARGAVSRGARWILDAWAPRIFACRSSPASASCCCCAPISMAPTRLLSAVELDERVPAQRRAAIETARARQAALRGENESANAGFRMALAIARKSRARRLGAHERTRPDRTGCTPGAARGGRTVRARIAPGHARCKGRPCRGAGRRAAGRHPVCPGPRRAGRAHARRSRKGTARQSRCPADPARGSAACFAASGSKGPALERVAARARETGFELLALRAEMLADGAGPHRRGPSSVVAAWRSTACRRRSPIERARMAARRVLLASTDSQKFQKISEFLHAFPVARWRIVERCRGTRGAIRCAASPNRSTEINCVSTATLCVALMFVLMLYRVLGRAAAAAVLQRPGRRPLAVRPGLYGRALDRARARPCCWSATAPCSASSMRPNPSALVVLGEVSVSDPVRSIDVSPDGNLVAVSDWRSTIHLVDITNRCAPQARGSLVIAGNRQPYGLDIVGNRLYVAIRDAGVGIFDISDIDNPAALGITAMGATGFVFDLEVRGNYAYLADDAEGVTVVDISNAASPAMVGAFAGSTLASRIVIDGNRAYVARRGDGFDILDLTVPTAPTLIGNYDTAGDRLRRAAARRRPPRRCRWLQRIVRLRHQQPGRAGAARQRTNRPMASPRSATMAYMIPGLLAALAAARDRLQPIRWHRRLRDSLDFFNDTAEVRVVGSPRAGRPSRQRIEHPRPGQSAGAGARRWLPFRQRRCHRCRVDQRARHRRQLWPARGRQRVQPGQSATGFDRQRTRPAARPQIAMATACSPPGDSAA